MYPPPLLRNKLLFSLIIRSAAASSTLPFDSFTTITEPVFFGKLTKQLNRLKLTQQTFNGASVVDRSLLYKLYTPSREFENTRALHHSTTEAEVK